MFLLCICVCFLSSCGNVKGNTESQVSEKKNLKIMHLIFGEHPATKSHLAIKLFTQYRI